MTAGMFPPALWSSLNHFSPSYLLPSGNGAIFPGHLLTKPFLSEHGIRRAAAISCPCDTYTEGSTLPV